MKSRYTSEHLDFLRDAFSRMEYRDIVPVFNKRFGLNKTPGQIKSCLKNHNITCGRVGMMKGKRVEYPRDRIAWLRKHYPVMSQRDLTAAFNAEFGTCKTVDQIKSVLGRFDIHSGRTGRFDKGNEPFNKGVKGWQAGGRSRVTQFKKGSVPPNRKPLGTERICTKDGYILIKVAERNPHTGSPTRYKAKHIVIWERDHGPAPKGHAIIFRDGDIRNIEPENLLLVSRAELLNLNQQGFKGAPAELRESMLALAKLEIKQFELSKEEQS